MKNFEPELAAKPRYEVLDGLRGVAAAVGFAVSWENCRFPCTSCTSRLPICRWRG
ncbi:MAG: hypothetical protein Q4A17_01505 [Thermoguttaceae bacterium]|nr:hypothetical protein [Thermoguttaceae bacterium]